MRFLFLFFCLTSWKAQAVPQNVETETPSSDNSPVLSQPQTPDQDLGIQENPVQNALPSGSESLPSVQAQNAQIILPAQAKTSPQTQKTKVSPSLDKSPAKAVARRSLFQTQAKSKNLPVGIPPSNQAWTAREPSLNSIQNANPEDVEALQNQLRKIFDREAASPKRRKKTSSPQVPGKAENAFDRVYQAASVAASASAYDAPLLFKSALSTTDKAVKKGELVRAIASQFKRAILQSALIKAEKSLPGLLKSTAEAALNRRDSLFARGLKAFESWNGLLGIRKKPIILNWTETRSYLQNLKKSAPQETDARVQVNSSLRMEKMPSGQFKAVLPPFELATLSLKFLPRDFSQAGNLALVFGAQKVFSPTVAISWKAFYDLERNLGRKSPLAAAWTAAQYSVRIAGRRLWNWFWRVVSLLREPTRVNFGNGIEFKTHTPAFQGILRFLDKNSGGQLPGSSVVFLDLRSLTGPYFDFKRAPSARAAENLAKAYESLSGDSSGIQGLSDLTRTLKAAPASLADSKILSYWTERIYASAVAFLFQALKRASENTKRPVFFADQGTLQAQGTVLLVFQDSENNRASSLLKEAGFDAYVQSGWVYALKYPKPEEVESAILLAKAVALGKITSLPQKSGVWASKPFEDKRISQAVSAYQGLKDNQALINWWNQFAETPNALPMAITLSRKLWALKKNSRLSKKSLISVFKAIKRSLPKADQKRQFSSFLKTLTHRKI